MTLIGLFIRLLARALESLGTSLYRLSYFLNGFLPVLLPPSRLTALIKHHYLSVYTNRFSPTGQDFEEYSLAIWEAEIFDRYKIRNGRMLVLGCGWGREALTLARRGVTVVGLDSNYNALKSACRLAQDAAVQASFHQADFLELPYASASFDYALLTYNMYSAIPGTTCRQALVRDLGRILKPHGLVILSFLREHGPMSRQKVVQSFLSRTLSKLPGTNPSYQPGDNCQGGHFFHVFQDAEEIRRELAGAGARLRELDWTKEFAVVTYPTQRRDFLTPGEGRDTLP